MKPQSSYLADLDAIVAGRMTLVKQGDRQIILVRRGDSVLAMDGTCPHAGGPLAEGVLDGDRVICLWHKAAFCIRDGHVVDPPALDDLPPIAIDCREGAVWLVDTPVAGETESFSPSDPRCFVLLGAGAAGASAAQSLRTAGFSGRIVMVDREAALPYDRTILSKYVLAGTKAGEKTPLQDGDFYHRHAIERLHAEIVALYPDKRRILFKDGTTLEYDAALIATGGTPNMPGFARAGLANVFTLRSAADADRIADIAKTATRAVVIGGGFIGLEAAGALRERGLDVTVVSEAAHPLESQLGAKIGTVLQRLHEAQGVMFKLGRKVTGLEGDGAVRHVKLDNDETIEADLVLIGLGIRPATSILQGIPLAEDGSLPVDAALRAAPGLYAAGDIARFPLYGDGDPIRVEHWRVAQQHGALAAQNMLGADIPYRSVPVFWTIHYMQRLDYVGHGSGDDDLVVHGDLEARDFIAYYCRAGQVVAAAGMGRDRDMAAIVALLDRRRFWTVDEIHPATSSPAETLAGLDPA
jgi:NADPH-dependent 2,4-dienoyl-CoA reductase/sulfur reductase-like enzyme/nitrite reductase/ring-hydroxylating ferredoxin subunit